ncbi:hypothetical protein ACFWNN_26990 [Lentzea sp. NPDC058450]|uniref:hypothetical protein n=1 Tax=Lentzea sp. NPDC058450 TaxID=3346505 RepID=UPI00365C5C12
MDTFLRWSAKKWVQVPAWVAFVIAGPSLVLWLRRSGTPTRWFLIADLGFVAVYAVAYFGALHSLWGNKRILLIPAAGVVADVVEDVLLLASPQLSGEPALKAVEAVKLTCFWLTLFLVAAGAVRRKAKSRG